MSLNEQLEILGISKGSYYYKAVEMDTKTDKIMKFIDKEHTVFLGKGVVGMKDSINEHFQKEDPDFRIGERKVRRLMHLMNIHASYPVPRLSVLGSATYVHPYLLRKLNIERPNQVWSTDISYIPMGKGFLYLYAIIDVYSRYVVSWGLYSTLESANAIDVLERGIRQHGIPEILNSDQGSQYTCKEWVDTLHKYGITISMDGKGRCKDNIWIERFWRTIKNEYIYFHPFDDGAEMREGIRWYIDYYNNSRHHQGIGHEKPRSLYFRQALPKVA